MMELTISDKIYKFNFGMGFLREVNKKYQKPIDNIPDAKEKIGLQMMVAGLYGKDPEYLVEVLEAANKDQNPRIMKSALDAYIDDPDTDIDALFAEVLDFLKSANATKNTTVQFLKAIEEQQTKAETK